MQSFALLNENRSRFFYAKLRTFWTKIVLVFLMIVFFQARGRFVPTTVNHLRKQSGWLISKVILFFLIIFFFNGVLIRILDFKISRILVLISLCLHLKLSDRLALYSCSMLIYIFLTSVVDPSGFQIRIRPWEKNWSGSGSYPKYDKFENSVTKNYVYIWY